MHHTICTQVMMIHLFYFEQFFFFILGKHTLFMFLSIKLCIEKFK